MRCPFESDICSKTRELKRKELLKMFPKYSRRSVYRHAAKAFDSVEGDTRKLNHGQPRKLNNRDERAVVREIQKLRDSDGSFTTKHLKVTAGIDERVFDEIVCRTLKEFGYGYYHSREKRLLKIKDFNARRVFAVHIKKPWRKRFGPRVLLSILIGPVFNTSITLSMRQNQHVLAWRRKREGLDLNCTAKGSHVGFGGRVAHFLVAIAFNGGVILCQQYHRNINGEMFAQFILEHFNDISEKSANPKEKLFLQDRIPSQNSKKAKAIFSIPPRSLDMNPIENIFNVTKEMLHADALSKNITKENFEEYSKHVKETLHSVPLGTISKAIGSMSIRIGMIVKRKGKRMR